MGVDCTLLPVEFENDQWGYSHTVLKLDRNYTVWEMLRKLPDAGAVPSSFASHIGGRVREGEQAGEPCYGETQKDPYGDPVRCVRAGDLAKLSKRLRSYGLPRTKASIAYCAQLPPETRIAIWWH